LVIIGATAYALLVEQFGGVRSFLSSRDVFTTFGLGYLLFLITLPYNAFIISYIGVRQFKRGHVMLLVGAMLTLGVALSTGARSLLIFPILSLAVARRYLHDERVASGPRPANGKLVAAIGVVVLLAFPGILAFRLGRGGNLTEIVDSIVAIYRDPGLLYFYTIGSHYQGIVPFVYTVLDTPVAMDYQLGRTYLESLVQWIPRQIYPEKPPSFAMEFTDAYIGGFYSSNLTIISPTLLGEGYINFHVVGMFAVAIMSGVFWRGLYQYLVVRNGRSLSGIATYSLLFPYTLVYWETFSGGFYPFIGTLVIAVMVCSFLATRR